MDVCMHVYIKGMNLSMLNKALIKGVCMYVCIMYVFVYNVCVCMCV